MLARMLTNFSRSTLVRSLAGGLLFAACLLEGPAVHAQGLGELTLESGLNEPLRASIELLETSGLEETQFAVSIATADEYAQAGLERSELVSQIEFDLDLRSLDGGRVTLTTRDRINEPFLSLLVSARWPSGRVLRDYTVLLDLPGAPAAVDASVAADAATPAAGQGITAPASAGGTYVVQSGDSLWEIAAQMRPDPDVAVPQMMIALQRANEDAFVNNNINRLITGRVLRMPPRDEIAIIEPAAAVAQVNAQNQELGLMPLGGSAPGGNAAARDELTLVGGDDAAAGGGGSSDLADTIAALEVELRLSEEDLDRARIEYEELSAQLQELEEQIAILQNIVAIEDERIAQLQNELAAQAEATDAALTEAGLAADTLAAAEQTQAAQGLAGQVLTLLQNNLIFIGVALAVVLAVVAALVIKAREAVQDEETDFAVAMDARSYAASEQYAADASYDVEDAESAAQEQGFIARLLARLHRRRAEDEYPGEELPPQDVVARPAGPAATIEVDEIPDELVGGLYEDDEFQPGKTARMQPSSAAADEEEDAAALASSVLDEVDSALQQIDQIEDAASESPAAETADEVETLAFSLHAGDDAAKPGTAEAPQPEPVIETLEFKPAASDDNFDLGSLTFDEDDAREADDAESAYTSRSNMDECDTKLDLAVAYEAMGDIDGAIEILDEVMVEGKPAQIEEAQRLKAKWQNA